VGLKPSSDWAERSTSIVINPSLGIWGVTLNFGAMDHMLFGLSEDLADYRRKRFFITVHGVSDGELVIQEEKC